MGKVLLVGNGSSDLLKDLRKDVNDLMYKQISITSFTHNVGIVEIGRTIQDITLSWVINKTPKELYLENSPIGISLKSKSFSGQNIKSDRVFTLKAVDERKNSSIKTVKVQFLNGVYYGVSSSDVSNDMILSLNKKLQDSKMLNFSVTSGSGQFIYFAVPSRYGVCKFNVGGFDGGFTKVSTLSFRNSSGYTESYDVYKSDNSNLGYISVKVS